MHWEHAELENETSTRTEAVPWRGHPGIFQRSTSRTTEAKRSKRRCDIADGEQHCNACLRRSSHSTIKRTFDVTTAGLAIMVLAPVLAVLALAVRLTSRGPIIFRQERLGLDGEMFEMFKFRTMKVNAESILTADPALHAEYLANDYKLPPGRDPRLTPIGANLRSLSLDELPQLFNILRGDMSIVGPRPIVAAEIERYGDRDRVYLAARPGLTGAWQVSGRCEIAYPGRVDMDEAYVTGWSLRKDLRILAKTPKVVAQRTGAH